MKKLIFKILISVLQLTAAMEACATEKSTIIQAGAGLELRAHSSSHASVPARKMQMLTVGGLSDGCARVYMYSDTDVVLYATLLKAVLSKATITLIYDIDASNRGPWGDTTACLLTSVTIVQ